MRDTLTHGALEVGAEDEDVEAGGAGQLVVQGAGCSLREAHAGVRCAFAVINGNGSLLLADIESSLWTDLGDCMRYVDAEEEHCVASEIGGTPFQVSLARAVQGGEVVHVGFEIVARTTQFRQRQVGDAADESEIGARSTDDPVGEETALEVVSREEGGMRGESAGAESEFPAEVGGVVDGRVEAEGAEDAMHVTCIEL